MYARMQTHLNCVSEVQKKELEQLGISSEKISTIPMGIDEAFLETGRIGSGIEEQIVSQFLAIGTFCRSIMFLY